MYNVSKYMYNVSKYMYNVSKYMYKVSTCSTVPHHVLVELKEAG